MSNQSAAAVTAFRKKLQAATRQAARNPDQLKKTLYGLKNEWVKIIGSYPEVDRVGNAQYLRILLTPGAMQFSGDDVDRYLGDLVGTLGWVERELKTQGKSAKMVIAAAKAVGTPRVKAQSPLLAPARALFNKINFLDIDAQEWRDAQADMNRLDDMIGGSQLTPGEKGIIAGALQNCDIALRGGLAALKRGAGISRDRYKQMALSAAREIMNELQ